ncbi:DMT family transporter [Aureivirga sp. CE67]|uniref:DMT family transporter n=1 Tax=Aureivirga sp. CE67 TaxID=1788983 RepID=UPI0018CBBF31|nr:DMT family transporter [Aureivirga sp. CE67]
MTKNEIKGISFSFLTAILIGVELIVVKLGLDKIDVLTVIWIQYSIAMIGFLLMTKGFNFDKQRLKKNYKMILISSLAQLGNIVFLYHAISELFPDFVAMMELSGDLFVIAGGILFLRESVAKTQKYGFVLVLIGIILYFNQTFSQVDSKHFNFGMLNLILAELCWAVYALTQKVLVKKEIPPCNLNLFTFLCTSIFLLPFVKFGHISSFDSRIWILISIAVIATLYTYTLFIQAFKYIDAGKVSVILAISPFLTVLLIYIYNFFGETPIQLVELNSLEVLGGILLFSGAVLSSWTPKTSKV